MERAFFLRKYLHMCKKMCNFAQNLVITLKIHEYELDN